MRAKLWLTGLILPPVIHGGVIVAAACGQEPCAACAYPAPPVACYAHPSDTGRYVGYYVGGGAATAWHGGPRQCNEGTWGWDYAGFGLLPHRVALLWNHGTKLQGGAGAYRTDGRPVKNVFAFPPPHLECAGEPNCPAGHP
jgi:hypothetical protein